MRRERVNPPKSLRASNIVMDVIEKDRPFAPGEQEEIVRLGRYAENVAVRTMRNHGNSYAADGLKKALSYVRSELSKAGKIVGKVSGAMGPPDVRKATERKLVGKRP